MKDPNEESNGGSTEGTDAARDGTDVLVVGAGPTGLTLALLLLRSGVRCRVIDSAPGPRLGSWAPAIHSRTLDIFRSLGIAGDLVAGGVRSNGLTVRGDRGKALSISFNDLDTPFPFELFVPQHETEALLRGALEAAGCVVEWNTRLETFQQDQESVGASVSQGGPNLQPITARYLVGCDGARSDVRTLAGLRFTDQRDVTEFLMADVALEWDQPGDSAATFFSNHGLVAAVPVPDGRWQIIASAPLSVAGAPSESDAATLDALRRLLYAGIPIPFKLTEADSVSRVQVVRRQVDRYRQGRALVAGDAAHVLGPVGGQGMNTGVQDAHNLAWKLAHVVSGASSDTLLDSYHAERHPVGAAALGATDAAMRVMAVRGRAPRAVRERLAGFLESLDTVRARLACNVADLGISYASSPIVETHAPGLVGLSVRGGKDPEAPHLRQGWKFRLAPDSGRWASDGEVYLPDQQDPIRLTTLMSGPRHHLVLFDGEADTSVGFERLHGLREEVERRFRPHVQTILVTPHAGNAYWPGTVVLDPDGELSARYGAQAECVYVIRPDRHIGYRAQPIDTAHLLAYLRRLLDGPSLSESIA